MYNNVKKAVLLGSLALTTALTGVFSVPFKNARAEVNAQKEHIAQIKDSLYSEPSFVAAQEAGKDLRIMHKDDQGDRLYRLGDREKDGFGGWIEVDGDVHSSKSYRAGIQAVQKKVETKDAKEAEIAEVVAPENEKLTEFKREASKATGKVMLSGLAAVMAFVAAARGMTAARRNNNDNENRIAQKAAPPSA